MYKDIIIENWANSLMAVAEEQNKIDKYLKNIVDVLKIVKSEPNFVSFYSNTRLSKHERKKMLTEVFNQKIEKDLLIFFKLMIDKSRFYLFIPIMKKIRKGFNNNKNVLYGKIYSVIKLNDTQIKKIEGIISKKLYNKEIHLINILDKDLIGGLKVEIRKHVYDSSLSNKLNILKKQIV